MIVFRVCKQYDPFRSCWLAGAENQCLVLFSMDLGPPTDAMIDPQQLLGELKGLPADEASWGSEDRNIHDTAKAYALYLGVLKP